MNTEVIFSSKTDLWETPQDLFDRLTDLYAAKCRGIKTWCSFEPVLYADAVLDCIENCHDLFDKVKIGKLNYYPSNIDWARFGREAEALCQKLGLDYYIKESLRMEMEDKP